MYGNKISSCLETRNFLPKGWAECSEAQPTVLAFLLCLLYYNNTKAPLGKAPMPAYLLAIDQGTTSSRAIIFNQKAELIGEHQIASKNSHPHSGWVEQDPEEIWKNTVTCCSEVLKLTHLKAKDITAAGISNQRETSIIWNKETGKAIYPAIIWQDRRMSMHFTALSQHKIAADIQNKTGLLLDPYFSANKILWILENIPNARQQAESGKLAFGTIDTFLLWRFTKGRVHATDATNASRTLLFNIRTQQWDKEILEAFKIPESILPEVKDCAADFGEVDKKFFGNEIPISAMIGDQQAATVGQACFEPGMIKATYGTGCFIVLNTGKQIVQSHNQLISTIAYRLNGKPTYGLEGSIFSAGITIKWLRDSLKLITSGAESEIMALHTTDNGGVYFVPAFTGLGAPYWDADARGALLGLTSSSTMEHIVRAGLEAVCYQTRDLLECMRLDGVKQLESLRVDGGMAVNNWLLQFLSDILGISVQRPYCVENTALGTAFLAGLQCGIFQSLTEISELWHADATFTPVLQNGQRDNLYQNWKKAVARVVTHN